MNVLIRIVVPLASVIILFGIGCFIFFPGALSISCGDGTLVGTCSQTKPFFCNQQAKLVEKASVCGCDGAFNISGEKCDSNLFTKAIKKNFLYYVNGKRGSLSLDLYGGLTEYLKNLPRDLTYIEGENASRADFNSRLLNDEFQKEALKKLIVEIQNKDSDKEDQVKIAVNLVQNIPYVEPEETKVLGGRFSLRLPRYPYQVLYENAGFCECKSNLLAYVLKELGYNVIIFYFPEQNHNAVGIKCPEEYSYDNTGYCFIETTSPSMISYSEGYYSGYVKLSKNYEIIKIGGENSLSYDLNDYEDAIQFAELNNKLVNGKDLNIVERDMYFNLKNYYGMN